MQEAWFATAALSSQSSRQEWSFCNQWAIAPQTMHEGCSCHSAGRRQDATETWLAFLRNILNLVLPQSPCLLQKRKDRHERFSNPVKHQTESLIRGLGFIAAGVSVKADVSRDLIGYSFSLSYGPNAAHRSYTVVFEKTTNWIISIAFLSRKGSLNKSNIWLFLVSNGGAIQFTNI